MTKISDIAWKRLTKDLSEYFKPKVFIHQAGDNFLAVVENATGEIYDWIDDLLYNHRYTQLNKSDAWVFEDRQSAEKFQTLFYLKWSQ